MPRLPVRARAATLALGLAAACASSTAPRTGRAPALDAGRARAAAAWLADPAREGRGTGTEGDARAARWIEDRFAELGLAPAFGSSYAQELDAPFRAVLEAGNALRVGGRELALREGWQPFTFSDNGAVEAEVVWAGYGIRAPDLGYDDYAGLDVKGKIVLVAQDFPRERDPASPFRDPRHYRHAEWRTKVIVAREQGAAAVLGVRDAWNHDRPEGLPDWRGTVASRAGVLAARVTPEALLAGGIDAAALAAPGQADGKPRSRALGIAARLAVDVRQERARTRNVAGLVPGKDPALARECVVVGAHHDHLGLGGEGSLAPDATGTVHPGADDNASGVAALLEIARALRADPPRRTVLVAAFAAEELGLLGSSELVRRPPAACPVEAMQLMVNLDMVGRAREKVYVEGVDTAKGLRERVQALHARAPPVPLALALGGDGYGPSDHTSFHAKGVPVLFLFTGAHADYHRPTDTAEKLDAEGLVAVAELALRAARDAADRDGRLEVVRTAAPAGREREGRGYGAYLGTIPDFAERTAPGVLLTGVRPGSPAERAGLAAGDVVLRVAETRVLSLQDLVHALRSHRPGDEVEVEWERGGRRAVTRVVLEERR